MPLPRLTLVRGHQGSGKTTQAHRLQAQEPDLKHFENDQFLLKEDGSYDFSWERYARAKQQCLDAVGKALASGQRVVVASTFTTLAELEPYFNLVPGEHVRVFEMFGDFPNTHGVPQDVIDAKKAAFEPHEGAVQMRGETFLPPPERPARAPRCP